MIGVLGRTAIQKIGSIAFLFSVFYLLIWASQQFNFGWGIQLAVDSIIPGSYESSIAPTSIVVVLRCGVIGLFARIFGQQLFSWITGNNPSKDLELHFNSPEDAFEHSRLFMKSEIMEGNVVPGLIKSVENIPHVGPTALVSIAENGIARTIPVALPLDAQSKFENQLCAILIGPKPPLSVSDHTAIVIGILQPTLTSNGWLIKERFSQA